MASLRARHSRKCALRGKETAAPRAERERVPGCTCKPTYSIRGAAGHGHERVGRDLRAALRALEKRRVAIDDGDFVPQANMRFREWADRWLDSLERKETTKESYKATIAYAKEAFGDKLVRKLVPADIVALNGLLREKKVSDSTRAKHLRVLGACLNSAVGHGYAAANPIKRIPKGEKPRPQRRESAYFTNSELPRLALPDGLYRTICLVALKTGMRMGELVALTWGDVDLSGGAIRVRRSYTGGHLGAPKSHEKRTVDLTDDVVELLGWWWGECGKPADDELVFARELGSGYLQQWEILWRLQQAMKRAGIPRTGPTGTDRNFHSLRHTYAKCALENGLQITWLSRQLGHSSLKVTTDIYGHWERAVAKQEAAKMAGVFGV